MSKIRRVGFVESTSLLDLVCIAKEDGSGADYTALVEVVTDKGLKFQFTKEEFEKLGRPRLEDKLVVTIEKKDESPK